MSLLSDYYTKQLFYEEKYGSKLAIVIQRGNFYGCFQYDPSNCSNDNHKKTKDGIEWTEKIGHAVELSTMLVLKLTKPNNNKPYSAENPNMIGFQVIAYDKVLKTLLANDYVVVRIDQEVTTEKDENEHVPRFVAEIVSPTMNFNRIGLSETSANIVSIYIEYMGSKNVSNYNGYLVTSGVASLDIITGHIKVTEFYSKTNDEVYCAQEIYRFLISHCPKEIIINIDDMPEDNGYSKYLDKILELRRYDRSKIFVNKVNKEYKKPNYQIEFLNKLYKSKSDHIIEELDLDKLHYGRLAFLLLVQYCHEYNGPVENLLPPEVNWFDDKNVLVLTHNAALCLEVIPNFRYQHKKREEINSLLSIMDQTCTHLGKRCLEYLLLNPMVDSKQIESYYNMVDELSLSFKNEYLWMVIEKRLKGLSDISRLQRKIELALMTPKDFALLIRSYVQIIELYSFIMSKNLPHLKANLNFDIDQLSDFVDHHMAIFNMNVLEGCMIDIQHGDKLLLFTDNPVKDDLLTKEYDLLMSTHKQLDDIDVYLNSLVKGKIKLTTKSSKNGKPLKGKTAGDGKITFFSASPAICTKLLLKYNVDICGKLTTTTYSASAKIISSPLIEALCFKKDEMKKTLGIKFLELFDRVMKQITNHVSIFTPLCNLIGKIDVLHCYAKLAYKNKYIRPTILHDGPSFLKIKDLRHPIVEKLIDGEYVVNDVSLGKLGNDISPYGNVLFSVNMTGKSCFLKAVGLNIIMAQIGCFTAGILLFRPYNKIITRLSCQDNIFKGQSSFEVEITELRTVLKQSNENTLVIIDELCKSTETQSAICITIGAIEILLNLKSSFLLASHLHEIINIPMISNVDKTLLTINHLTVINDEANDTLIYDRKLKPGSGSPIYGISVAKFLKIPNNLLDIANKVALYLEQENEEFLSTKTSRYNSDVYLDACEDCGGHDNLITHHINEQKNADERGFIGYMDKNVKKNLQVLCNDCHKKHHTKHIH